MTKHVKSKPLLKEGTHVLHKKLRLIGQVVKPQGLGVDPDFTVCVNFFTDGKDDIREVSLSMLIPLAQPPFPHPDNDVNRNDISCPRCKEGKNHGAGGNDKCFHCDTCDYVECIYCPCNWR